MPPKPRLPMLSGSLSLTWLRGTLPRNRPKTKGLKRKCDTVTRKFEKEFLAPHNFITALIRGAIKSGPGSSLKFPHITANFKTAEDVEAGTHTPVHIVITNPEAEPDVDFIIDIEKSEVLPGGQPDKIYPVPKKAEVKGESVHSDADEDGSWESDSDTEVRLAKDEGVTQKGQAEHGTEVPLVPKS